MHTEEYIELINDLSIDEEVGEISTTLNKKLARTAKVLEKEIDLSLDDIVADLLEILPKKDRQEDAWKYLLEELAQVIIDESEANASEGDDEDEEYDEDLSFE
jgi:hypothetical protein